MGPLSCTPPLAPCFSPGMGTGARLPPWHHLPTQLLPLVVDTNSAGFVSKWFPGCGGAGLPGGPALQCPPWPLCGVAVCVLSGPLGRRPRPRAAHSALLPSKVLGVNAHSRVWIASPELVFTFSSARTVIHTFSSDRAGQGYFRDARNSSRKRGRKRGPCF